MKRLTIGTLVMAGLFVLAGTTVVAQHGSMMKGEESENEAKSSRKGSMTKGKMMKQMSDRNMGGMMMGRMMQKKVIPTEDGGVVVMQGNKMYKYNKKMEKVGEATVEIDEEEMQQHMKKMKNMCEKCMQTWQEDGE